MFALDVREGAGIDDVRVPPLVLLPLAENAVKHGPARGHRGKIVVDAARHGDHVRVAIENPGRYGGPRDGSHGLPTLERRLVLAYDGAASLSIGGDDSRTRAVVSLPLTAPRIAT